MGIERLERLISPDKRRKRPKGKITDLDERLALVAITIVLVVIAAALLLISNAFAQSGIASCKDIYFSQQRYYCYAALANSTKNYSICQYLGQGAPACIANIAQYDLNVSICNQINGSNGYYDSCIKGISYAKGDAGYCLMLKDINESSCAYSIAQKAGFENMSDCDIIGNGSEKGMCIYAYDYSLAVKSDPAYCSQLPNMTNNTILYKLAANASEAYGIFAAYLNATPRSFCYYSVAQSYRNESYCADVYGNLSKSCYQSFIPQNLTINSSSNSSVLSNVTTLCSSNSSFIQNVCLFGVYTSIALSQENVTSCLKLANSTYQYSCIIQIAAKFNQSSFCNYIKGNSTAQQECMVSVVGK